MAHTIIVPGQEIHQAIDDALEVWVERFQEEFRAFEQETQQARARLKKDPAMWLDLMIPQKLYSLIQMRLRPILKRGDWLQDERANRAFRQVFIMGVIKNERSHFSVGADLKGAVEGK